MLPANTTLPTTGSPSPLVHPAALSVFTDITTTAVELVGVRSPVSRLASSFATMVSVMRADSLQFEVRESIVALPPILMVNDMTGRNDLPCILPPHKLVLVDVPAAIA